MNIKKKAEDKMNDSEDEGNISEYGDEDAPKSKSLSK